MRSVVGMLFVASLVCTGCGDTTLSDAETPREDDRDDNLQAQALLEQASPQFTVKSAAFEVIDTGLTRTLTLYASDQNNVCEDILQGRHHRNEHRLGLVGMTSGNTPIATQYTVTLQRSIPKAGSAMLFVPAFLAWDDKCNATTPRVVGGSMSVFSVDSKDVSAAYNLQVSDRRKTTVMGAVNAKHCKGLSKVRGPAGRGRCTD